MEWGYVPSKNNFAIIKKCNIMIQDEDNITDSGIFIDPNSFLTIAGNLIIINFMENYGFININNAIY